MERPNSSLTLRLQLVLAFAAVYVIWGSTYLAIRIGIETLPPFLMAGVRFLLAGGLLYGWALLRKAPWPDRRAWGAATIIGTLLLVGGNGGVTWAEQRVPSGLAALLIATEPLWIVLLDWLRPSGTRPTRAQIGGIALGFGGVLVLLRPAGGLTTDRVDLVGTGVILLAAVSWAIGSLYARGAALPASGAQASGMQMLAGGTILTALSLGTGELDTFDRGQVSVPSLIAFGYLVFFGSIIAFSAYAWLVKYTTPTQAATYAYVNPAVAVLLGWAVAHEPVHAWTLVATVVIISSVVLITIARPTSKGQQSTIDGERARPSAASQSEHG